MEQFDNKIISFYDRINALYPDLIIICNNLFGNDIVKFKKYLSIHCEITSDEISVPDDSDPVYEDDALLTKIVISELYKHLSNKSYSDYQNSLRKAIIKKKNNLKLKVNKDDFKKSKYYNDYSKKVCLSWLEDNDKLILSDFAFFDDLSSTIKYPITITTLDFVLCNIINSKDTYDLPNTGVLSVFNRNIKPSCSVNNKGLLDFYVDFQVDEGVYKRVFWARDLPPKAKINSDDSDKNEIVAYSEDYSDYFKLIIPDDEAQLIGMHIYNMINYDWCNKGYIEYYIDDIIFKMKSDLSKSKLSEAERAEKKRLKSKIFDTLNDMPDFRITDFTIDESTGKINIKDTLKGNLIFGESVFLDYKKEKIHTALSYNAIESWKGRKNTSVLKDDFEKIDNSSAKQILFFLQEYRIKSRNNNYSCSIPLSAFKEKFLSLSSDRAYLSRLIEALDELKLREILISNYKKIDKSINFEFIPLSNYELAQYNLK